MKALTKLVVAVAVTCAVVLVVASGVALALDKLGTNGPDTLKGTNKSDFLLGRGGGDDIYGLGGTDELQGGPGKDFVFGGKRERFLFSGGNKNLMGGPGNDFVNGGKGSDNTPTTYLRRRITLSYAAMAATGCSPIGQTCSHSTARG
jgi:hypothetical protein